MMQPGYFPANILFILIFVAANGFFLVSVYKLYRIMRLGQPEDRFDRITRMAAEAFNVPIVLISLVDRDRQWFKSRLGLDARETPRDRAFCAHTILDKQVMVIPDSLLDPRFADNPLVTGKPRVRFYAGYPLTLPDGTSPGTLCLIDTRPRELNAGKRELLRELGKLVEQELADTPLE